MLWKLYVVWKQIKTIWRFFKVLLYEILQPPEEEELIKNQTQERKALPKRIRQEMKAREMMFRESMRISVTNLNETLKPIEEKDRLKKV